MTDTLTTRAGMAQWIVNAEARRNNRGEIAVYKLPPGDGGGKYEVGGLNDRYHPEDAAFAAELVRSGQPAKAEAFVLDCIAHYTDPAERWCGQKSAIEFFVRDCIWNRGPRGAGKILQLSLGFDGKAVDGWIGPDTQRAIRQMMRQPARDWLAQLRTAREAYERRIAPPVGQRAKFWKGLVNRWDNCLAAALALA